MVGTAEWWENKVAMDAGKVSLERELG